MQLNANVAGIAIDECVSITLQRQVAHHVFGEIIFSLIGVWFVHQCRSVVDNNLLTINAIVFIQL